MCAAPHRRFFFQVNRVSPAQWKVKTHAYVGLGWGRCAISCFSAPSVRSVVREKRISHRSVSTRRVAFPDGGRHLQSCPHILSISIGGNTGGRNPSTSTRQRAGPRRACHGNASEAEYNSPSFVRAMTMVNNENTRNTKKSRTGTGWRKQPRTYPTSRDLKLLRKAQQPSRGLWLS